METQGGYIDIGRVPDISDLAALLDVPNLSSFYKGDSEVQGFNRTTLEFLANQMVEERRWENLADILALIIFGLVLFPNLENFIDNAALSIFWSTRIFQKDYVPALLADIYYTLEVRHTKRRGNMICCIPLLYHWLTIQIFPRSSIIPIMTRGEWTHKIASLNEQSVHSYALKTSRDEVITSCGNFTNVPLIGSRGCINYNPILSLRQLGFPMFVRPEEESLMGFVIHNLDHDAGLVIQIIQAWNDIHTKGPELRVRVGQRAESYKQWMQERVEIVRLPFIMRNLLLQVPLSFQLLWFPVKKPIA